MDGEDFSRSKRRKKVAKKLYVSSDDESGQSEDNENTLTRPPAIKSKKVFNKKIQDSELFPVSQFPNGMLI